MKKIAFLILLFLSTQMYGQKVGLVLSGGAAKGLAHVGVLRALEENEIPIDYIAGTSIGGIIGGCYASGMSPDQIEQMVLSEEFLRWINGQPEEGYNYYYHLSDDNPNFLKLNLSLDSTLNVQLNASLANDVSLNFALAEKMAQASAISKNNFDSLFVPLRVVAADIFTQNEVILSKGSLSDALRATQTVPFFYTPIRVDGKYLFDGGVYNNFPVDVLQRDFHPEVIIGVNVSTKIYDQYPYDKDDKLISNSLLYMLLDKSDPKEIPDNGVYIQPNLSGYTAFDFGKVRSLIDSGYTQTMRHMAEIKAKILTRTTCEEVAVRRNIFTNRQYPFVFNDLSFGGFDSKQQKYISRIFKYNPDKLQPLSFGAIKQGYFEFVSEEYFSNVYPKILFDQNKKSFQLQLLKRPQKNFQLDFGGVIASRDISSIYLGLNYYNFGSTLIHVHGGFQTGDFYKAAVAKIRIDLPFQFYIEPDVSFDSWDYLANTDFIQQQSTTVLKRVNRKYALNVGWPMGNSFKGFVRVEGINNSDRYSNDDSFSSAATLDELKLKGYKLGFTISTNTLNRKQYASSGRSYSLSGYYFNVNGYYTPGSTSVTNQQTETPYQWFRLRAGAEQYFKAGWFRPGYFVEAVFSNQPSFQNYKGTIINAPAFFPIQDSRTLLLENFRAFNYVAGGMRNVFVLKKRLDFRLEAYLFKPIQYLQQGNNQETIQSTDFRSVFFAATAGLVMHSPIGPISLSVNYYDDNQNQYGVLLHVGYLLFNRHSLE